MIVRFLLLVLMQFPLNLRGQIEDIDQKALYKKYKVTEISEYQTDGLKEEVFTTRYKTDQNGYFVEIKILDLDTFYFKGLTSYYAKQTFQDDKLMSLTEVEVLQEGDTVIGQTFFKYDELGNLVQEWTSAGDTTHYLYDYDGDFQVAWCKWGKVVDTIYVVDSFSYYDSGLLKTKARTLYENDVKTFQRKWMHDSLGRAVVMVQMTSVYGLDTPATQTHYIYKDGRLSEERYKDLIPGWFQRKDVTKRYFYDKRGLLNQFVFLRDDKVVYSYRYTYK